VHCYAHLPAAASADTLRLFAGLTSLKLSRWQVKQLPASLGQLANVQLTYWGSCCCPCTCSRCICTPHQPQAQQLAGQAAASFHRPAGKTATDLLGVLLLSVVWLALLSVLFACAAAGDASAVTRTLLITSAGQARFPFLPYLGMLLALHLFTLHLQASPASSSAAGRFPQPAGKPATDLPWVLLLPLHLFTLRLQASPA
jgi:hypothetical protein